MKQSLFVFFFLILYSGLALAQDRLTVIDYKHNQSVSFGANTTIRIKQAKETKFQKVTIDSVADSGIYFNHGSYIRLSHIKTIRKATWRNTYKYVAFYAGSLALLVVLDAAQADGVAVVAVGLSAISIYYVITRGIMSTHRTYTAGKYIVFKVTP